MAMMSEKGSFKPALITLGIALVLMTWAAYAWSAAGFLPTMPFTKLALVSITSIYLVRGLGGLIIPFVTDHAQIKQNSIVFWIWSSAISTLVGLCHLLGLVEIWQTF